MLFYFVSCERFAYTTFDRVHITFNYYCMSYLINEYINVYELINVWICIIDHMRGEWILNNKWVGISQFIYLGDDNIVTQTIFYMSTKKI